MRQLAISLALALLIMASSASAFCGGSYSDRYPITDGTGQASFYYANDTGGLDFGGGAQLVICDDSANYACYNGAADYRCYNDDTAVLTIPDEGSGSKYGTMDADVVGFYRLNGTDVHDDSQYDNTIGVVKSMSVIDAKMGKGLNTSGNGHFNLSGLYNTEATEGTVSFWVKINNVGDTCRNEKKVDNNNWLQINFHNYGVYTSTYQIQSKLAGTYRINYLADADQFPIGEWFMFTMTWNSSGLQAWTNTTLVTWASSACGGAACSWGGFNQLWTFGEDQTAAIDCKAGFDNMLFMTSVMSNQEIADRVNNTAPIGYSTAGASEAAPAGSNITLTLGVNPATLYNLTAANFSIFYNETNGNDADVTINVTVNGANITDTVTTYNSVAANTTLYYYVGAANYSKHDNVTLYVNVTTAIAETGNDTLTKEIQNSPGSAPAVTWTPASVIIGDTLNMTGSSTDDDGDALTYHYLLGWLNGTNITGWNLTIDLDVAASHENETFRIYVMADDGEENGTSTISDMNVTNLVILWPVNGEEYYGKTFNYSFDFVAEATQPCYEIIDNTTYSLGNISAGEQNNSRYVWYGNHTYNVTCYSLQDSSRVYYKTANYSNYYANWTISIMTENEWDTPLNITAANLSIIITCEGGETYVYNFTGTELSNIKPPCDVETVSAQVNYATDSYLRERLPPCEGDCDVEMYMVDALVYTVLQIPIYMSDYNYYDAEIELYKLSGGQHYTIAQGYFDVEHKYVTYLTKDNTYLLRLTLDGEIRDIGFLYAATATAQYLSLSQISLRPDITLISDNILMSAEFDDPTANQSTLRIQYRDYINMTESVNVLVYSMTNNTPWYNNTITGSSNFTITINNVNTTRHSVRFIVNHGVLGNSPIPYTIGVGTFAGFDMGLPAEMVWLYNGFAFFIILVTSWIITPENRLPGYLLLLSELGIFSIGTWLAGYASASIALFVAFIVAGIVYEIRYKGVS